MNQELDFDLLLKLKELEKETNFHFVIDKPYEKWQDGTISPGNQVLFPEDNNGTAGGDIYGI